ncbi:MAG: ABC transporter substrate-binding protein [Deltaproteobacteria bacterium]|nr:ABC transporter substrate-binding protein [Deltaproteobacteria bacterium]
MKNIFRLVALIVALVGFGGIVEAQPKKVPRIGFLGGFPAAHTAHIEALRQGLRELGYVGGKNILIEYRYSEGKLDRRAVAAELVRLKVEVIVTSGATSTRAAKEATTTIPIVMGQGPDPVANGFVASLARPGGNITGLSSLGQEISGKRLELLKEIVPKLSRVAVLADATQPGIGQSRREMEVTARALAVQLQYLEVRDSKDIEAAFREASKGRVEAFLVLGGPVLNSNRTQVLDLVAKNRLPAMHSQRESIDSGGLMFYGASVTDMFRRAATYVDKILKGAKPADLPVEQPTKFELVINLKTAKALGVKIPPHLLMEADKVIE